MEIGQIIVIGFKLLRSPFKKQRQISFRVKLTPGAYLVRLF